MGCITIEHFKEIANSHEKFGQNLHAFVNAAHKPYEVTINELDIAQFEDIVLITARPGIENKEDHIEGVRLLTFTGKAYVIFNDCDESFQDKYASIIGTNRFVSLTAKDSTYLAQFKK